MRDADFVTPQLQAMRQRLSEVSTSFCLAKWLQTTLHLEGGMTQSCHHVRAHKITFPGDLKRPQDLHNTPEKMAARQQMLTGNRPKECGYCWRAEDRGRLSDRVIKSAAAWARPSFERVVQSKLGEDIAPSYLEVSFSTDCNFRCMYCGPQSSSAWREEINKLGGYPTLTAYNGEFTKGLGKKLGVPDVDPQVYRDLFWRWWPTLSSELADFRITGGEPLLHDDTFRILSWLAEHPRPELKLSINTNLSLGGERLERLIRMINALKGRIRNFTLFVSLDGVDQRAEYVRTGLRIDRFKAHAEQMLKSIDLPFSFAFMITVNALSVTGLTDLLKYILHLRRSFPDRAIPFDAPYLSNPRFLSVGVLPKRYGTYVEQAVEFMKAERAAPGRLGFSDLEIVTVERIGDMIALPADRGWKRYLLRRDFSKMIAEFDRRRGLSFAATFPELEDFRKSCPRW